MTLRRVGLSLSASIAFLVWLAVPAFGSLPVTSTPVLQLARTIRTTPFVGSSISTKDAEGSAFVPSDNSLWLNGDNDRAAWEVNPATGALKRLIDRTVFEAAPQLHGGPAAGPNRSGDLESIAYDEANDLLYVFSGRCCVASELPTAFRLARDQSGIFQMESYQPLPSGSDYTGAAWNSADGKLYVGMGKNLRTYDYETNVSGPTFKIPNVSGILGLAFSSNGADLFVTTNADRLFRVDWGSKTILPGWNLDLKPFGVRDSRAVEVIPNPNPNGFDQFYVFDGYDGRPNGDPLEYAVFVFDVFDGAGTAPTASFTASPTSGDAPLTVDFTDTSSGNPTTWQWDFGDTATSTEQNPTHTYTSPGTYTVSLTASNTLGQSSATGQVTALQNLVGNPGFEVNTAGWNTSGSVAGVTLSRVQGSHTGEWAGLLTNGGATSGKCNLNDQPNWIATSAAGTYTGRLWVRADSPGATLRLRLRESTGGTQVGLQVSQHQLATSWKLVTVTYVPQMPGTSTLDFTAWVADAFPGTCFYVDDASISVS